MFKKPGTTFLDDNTSQDGEPRRNSQSSTNSRTSKASTATTTHQALNDYIFSYEDVLDQDDTRQCFLNFLNDVQSGALLEFLEMIQEMKTKKSVQNKFKVAVDLYNRFIASMSSEKTNVSISFPSRITTKIIQGFSRVNVSENPEFQITPLQSTLPKSIPGSISSSGFGTAYTPPNQVSSLDTSELDADTDSTTDDVISQGGEQLSQLTIEQFMKEYGGSLFLEAEQYANITLKENFFAVFLTSPHFQTLLQSKKKEGDGVFKKFLDTIGTLKPVSHENFVTLLQTMKLRRLSKAHMQLIKYYTLSTDFWRVFKEGDNYTVYLSNESYRMDTNTEKKIFFYKYDITFPFNVHRVMECLLKTENRKQYDNMLKSCTRLENYPKGRSDEELACELLQEEYKMKWPVANRYFTYLVSGVHDSSDDMYIICAKCVDTEKEKPVKDAIKGSILTGWAFKAIDENSCKYYQFSGLDARGSVPVKLVNHMIKKRAKTYAKTVLEFLKKSEKNGWNSEGRNVALECITENGSFDLTA